MFTHELKTAIIEALQAVPEVRQVNHLEYWAEDIYFVVLQPNNDESRGKAETALAALLQHPGNIRPNRVRLRYFSTRDLLPSSATLYQREASV